MGRKRWAERRAKQAAPVLVEIDEATWFHAGVLQCGYPLGDGAMCMVPASAEHVATHETQRQLIEGTAKAPAGSGAPAGEMRPSLYRELTGRPYPRGLATDHGNHPGPTYEALKAAAANRAQFTPEQAQEILSAALGTRPRLAARVIDRLGPVLAGELARAVDGAVNGRINRYLADERATLDRLYTDQLAKLQTDQERRGRDVNAERWTTPSRLS